MAMEALRLNNVGRRFQKLISQDPLGTGKQTAGDFWALRNIYMNVKGGEIVGVIGRNGAGKTTLFNIIAGVLPASEGELLVQGNVSALLTLGAGFQEEFTGKENIYLNGTLLGLAKSQIDKLFTQILDFSELGDFINAPLGSYSNGMKMRLGFSVVIHKDFNILLTDEIISVGDFYFQKKCLQKMLEFKKAGKTILIVTHDMGMIRNFCDRAYLLEDGKILFEGSNRDAAERYEALLNKKKILSETSRLEMVKQTRRWATDREEWGRQEGTGEVKIKGVSICNSWGRPVERIWPKDKLRVKVFFEVKEEIDNYHFGVAVFREDGVYCFGPNTKFAGLALKKMGKGRGSFEVGFKELLLMAGTYYISVAVWDEHETLPYDYHRCNYKIEIGGDNLYGQLLCLPYSWANSTVERKFRFPIKIDGYPNVDFLVDKWEDELKNDSAKLKSVRCLDNYGAEDGAFISGRDMKIKVDFEVSPDFSAKLMLWLGIYRSDGIYCQGQAKDIASCGPNSEILILPKLRLLPGGYRVSAGIWDKNNNRFLGYTHGLYSFNMVSDRMDHGTIYLEHSWRCNIPEAKEGR